MTMWWSSCAQAPRGQCQFTSAHLLPKPLSRVEADRVIGRHWRLKQQWLHAHLHVHMYTERTMPTVKCTNVTPTKRHKEANKCWHGCRHATWMPERVNAWICESRYGCLHVCVCNIWTDVKFLIEFYSICRGPRLHSSVRGQRSYWCLERICSLINCTYLLFSDIARGQA